MRLFAKLPLLIFALSASAWAQFPLSVGVKAGVPLTDAFSTSRDEAGSIYSPGSKNYIVGPMVELRLPFGLGVEADALYRPLGLNYRSFDNAFRESTNDTTWEFPILAKYRFRFPIVKPYVEAGPSFRTRSQYVTYLSNKGVTFGAGVDVHFLLHIAPEFRYTHWANDSSLVGNPTVPSKQDQVEFLVGFSF